jgi:hypothetical protein
VTEQRPRTRTWVWYSVVRVGIFAVVLAVLLLVLPVQPWISTLLAAVIAFCLSFILLGRPRAELAEDLERIRKGEKAVIEEPSDDDVEDAAIQSSPAARPRSSDS